MNILFLLLIGVTAFSPGCITRGEHLRRMKVCQEQNEVLKAQNDAYVERLKRFNQIGENNILR